MSRLSIYDKALRAHMARPLSSLLGNHVNQPGRVQRYARLENGQILREDTARRWKLFGDLPNPRRLKRRQRLRQRRSTAQQG